MVVLLSGTAALLAAGTGISLAATGNSSGGSVTCLVVADAKAKADANTALSDHFAVGTPLHVTSAGRQVDVTVSGPISAAAAGKAQSNSVKSAQVDAAKTGVQADQNGGVDSNTVCVQLSKDAFDKAGNVGSGNNVGAFLATITSTGSAVKDAAVPGGVQPKVGNAAGVNGGLLGRLRNAQQNNGNQNNGGGAAQNGPFGGNANPNSLQSNISRAVKGTGAAGGNAQQNSGNQNNGGGAAQNGPFGGNANPNSLQSNISRAVKGTS